jgi:NAD-dependent DNA ligase
MMKFDLTFTGIDPSGKSRRELTDLAVSQGWTVRSSLTSKTTILVADPLLLASSAPNRKIDGARLRGIHIWTYDQFHTTIENCSSIRKMFDPNRPRPSRRPSAP